MDVHSTSSTYPEEGAPAGYKQTEVGVIPEDWEVKPMAELFTFQNGVNAEKSAYGSGVPFINVLEVITHSTITETRIPGRITLTAPALNAFTVQRGDVLFNRTSETQEEVGLASVYVGTEAVVFGGFVIRARPRDSRLDSSFTAYALRSPIVRSQIVARGQGAVRANIGQKDLSRVQVFLPTKAEQEAIAEALSDVDKLLGSLEKLLVKKRATKQGMMQQLLTGKTRLPGFSGEWETRRLGNIAPLQRGFDLPTPQIRPGSYAVVYSNGVLHHHERAMVNGPGVVTGRSGTIGKVHFIEKDYWPHNTALWVTSFCGNDPKFIYFFYTHVGLMRFLSGSGVPTLNRNDVHQHLAPCPPLPEQRAIATVLSDMDTEIAVLERRRDKTHAVKQGMMQQLLTGRVRLISVREGNDHVS